MLSTLVGSAVIAIFIIISFVWFKVLSKKERSLDGADIFFYTFFSSLLGVVTITVILGSLVGIISLYNNVGLLPIICGTVIIGLPVLAIAISVIRKSK